MWVLALLAACEPRAPIYGGIQTHPLFPFDCERTWEFTSTDTTLPYKLLAISDVAPEANQGTNIYTLRYTTECFGADPDCVDGEILRKIQWSSTTGDGVMIHGYSIGEDAITKFEPPIQLGLERMKKALDPENPGEGEFAETTTGGATWTSVLVDIGDCPVRMSVDWTECASFELSTDGGDGIPLAGTWWAIGGQGVVAFEVAGDTGQWQASSVSADESDALGACDGDW